MSKPKLIRSLLVAMLGFGPLLNALSNPRLAGINGRDFLQLAAIGWCFGIAVGIQLGARWRFGEKKAQP